MDHQQHQQWRPRPQIHGNICPTCSLSHFPFCPPLPSFNQNPRFPFEGNHSFQRPGFDPYRSPAGMHRPLLGNPNDGFANPRPWGRSPQEQVAYGEGFAPPPPPPYEYGGNGFVGESDRFFKRPRVDDPNPAGISWDNERRLKLIREHGSVQSRQSEVGSNSVIENNYGKHVYNMDRNKFQDQGFGSGEDRKHKKESDLASEQQFMQNKCNGSHSDTKEGDSRNRGSTMDDSRYSHINSWQGPPYNEHRSSVVTNNGDPNNQLPHHYGQHHHPVHMNRDIHAYGQPPLQEVNQGSVGNPHIRGVAARGTPNMYEPGGYFPRPGGGSLVPESMGHMQASRLFGGQPPLPASPPPPLPMDPPKQPKLSLFPVPVPVSSSSTMSSSCQSVPEAQSLPQPYFHAKTFMHSSASFVTEESQAFHGALSKQYAGVDQPFPLKQSSSDKPTVVDASHIFKQPYRASRPDHFVIILRGLPGSGKSYMAKMLRDVEVENGGDAPRIHSMDDYFMTEVEKVEEGDISKSSSSLRGKKRVMKKVMEYCYEPEMEEAYRSSMLKAFKKTLEEGVFTFIIVDDRNLRVADFAQFWAVAKSSGYEVYILEAPYKDPAGCAARNVHSFTQDDIQKMAGQWEESPSLYLQLDVKSLFNGDDLKKSGIQEVDMDMEDEENDDVLSGLQEKKPHKIILPPVGNDAPGSSSKEGQSWNTEEDQAMEVKELGRSKWSNELDEDDTEQTEISKGNLNALSGLIQAYGKEAKSVRWGDQVGNTGFSIGAAKKANMLSLVIGPGAGYNWKSNPLPEEECSTPRQSNGALKKRSIFQEQLRAERESFKAVFDTRQRRIGVNLEEE